MFRATGRQPIVVEWLDVVDLGMAIGKDEARATAVSTIVPGPRSELPIPEGRTPHPVGLTRYRDTIRMPERETTFVREHPFPTVHNIGPAVPAVVFVTRRHDGSLGRIIPDLETVFRRID